VATPDEQQPAVLVAHDRTCALHGEAFPSIVCRGHHPAD